MPYAFASNLLKDEYGQREMEWICPSKSAPRPLAPPLKQGRKEEREEGRRKGRKEIINNNKEGRKELLIPKGVDRFFSEKPRGGCFPPPPCWFSADHSLTAKAMFPNHPDFY